MSNKEVSLKFIEKTTNHFLASTCINMLIQILDEISTTERRRTIPTYRDEYLYFASVIIAPPQVSEVRSGLFVPPSRVITGNQWYHLRGRKTSSCPCPNFQVLLLVQNNFLGEISRPQNVSCIVSTQTIKQIPLISLK